MNPLLEKYNTLFNSVPFDKINTEHYLPAFEFAFAEGRREIELIANNTETATFQNTIAALDSAGEKLGQITSILFNLNHAETSEAIQNIAREISPKLTEFSNDITLNPKLFSRIKDVLEKGQEEKLDTEQESLLEKTHRSFIRSGANLSDAAKEEYRSNAKSLSELTVKFSENVLAETNAFTLLVTNESDLAGLPKSVIQAARKDAEDAKKEGWLFSLQFPSFMPFMKYAENRSLRKELFIASGTRCLKGNEFDNQDLVQKICSLRYSQAKLFGFKNYAEFILDSRMAETPEKVHSFLAELKKAYLTHAKNEVGEVQSYAVETGADFELKAWDWSFFSEKLKEERYKLIDEQIRPYFELDHTVNRVFELAHKLYGIQLQENSEIPSYHPDVKVYEVYNENKEFLSLLYMDYFPRKTKKPGAWMTGFKDQYIAKGKNFRPHISLVFNFTKPTETQPSLLNYDELRTLLHEFGHGLHGMLSQVSYKSLSGTSVYRDFVELPSQIMENWAEQEVWLKQVAIHYQTKEEMPSAMLTKILDSRNYNLAYFGIRQLGFGIIDMAWHSLESDFDKNIIDFETGVTESISIFPKTKETAISTAFSHIFAGGYAAGYYGYKWAEVLDADAFSQFKEHGIFNKEVAKKFRDTILSKGGTKHPMKLFVDFMGREPSIDALLERSGLK